MTITLSLNSLKLKPRCYSNKNVKLVILAKKGDEKAIELLVRKHFRSCYALALSILKNPEDAEDSAQEAIVRALKNLHQLKDEKKFVPWLMQIVRNQSKTALRKIIKHKKHHSFKGENYEFADTKPKVDNDLKEDLLFALNKLSKIERSVVLFHDMDGMKHKQISKILNISEVMSRQHLFTARKKMRKYLKKSEKTK
jgi:RNA polymerase sigma-70 factor, ECF subfamily